MVWRILVTTVLALGGLWATFRPVHSVELRAWERNSSPISQQDCSPIPGWYSVVTDRASYLIATTLIVLWIWMA